MKEGANVDAVADVAGQERGIALGAAAFFWWGCFPLYWSLLKAVPAVEILAHRVFWSLWFALIMLVIDRRMGRFIRLVTDRRIIARSLVSALFIGVNWGMYIWAVNNGYVLHAGLGYFLNPLFNVLLGVVLLGERLGAMQKRALVLACIGCLTMVFYAGEIPWVGFLLALTFAIYAWMRKTSSIESLEGFALETILLSPAAALFLYYSSIQGTLAFLHQNFLTDMLLVGAGSVTAVPLILFAQSARQIPLTVLGILQYISPTCQFLLAVFYFHESFTWAHFISFGFIWCGLAFFTFDLWHAGKRRRERLMRGMEPTGAVSDCRK